ncbi:hypothetical protein E2C01_000795 [Portunus trituberculatus]|uniref:Uncharacterized protein n=1 Tax=Portunus trituberculatus TaxID=210409 RepID=A0A5B7CG29_PORTR|nr:hypothetical protein [Portunus trituberculatus]
MLPHPKTPISHKSPKIVGNESQDEFKKKYWYESCFIKLGADCIDIHDFPFLANPMHWSARAGRIQQLYTNSSSSRRTGASRERPPTSRDRKGGVL